MTNRRNFVTVLAGAGLSASVTAAPLVNRGIADSKDVAQDWASFVKDASALFTDVEDVTDIEDEVYVHSLAALASELRTVPDVPTFTNAGLGGGIRTGPIAIRPKQRYFALKWELSAHSVLPYHDHPNYSFVTINLGGELRVRNYEIEGDAPPYDSERVFSIRQTQDQLLLPGRINTLTRKRDYIHTFEAGSAGAVGIDIGILHGSDIGFSYLSLGDQSGSLIDARWNQTLTRAVRGSTT